MRLLQGITSMTDEVVFYHNPRPRAQMAHLMLATAPGQGPYLLGVRFSAAEGAAC